MAVVQISEAQGRVPVTIFRLQDRVNLGNFAELEETARSSYDNGTRDMVMDLSQTVSLTSIGIRAIVIIHKMLSPDGGKHLKIANPVPYIREMLDVSGVTQFIEVYNTVDEAVASF
jgi:anti-anti-sigma factor